MRETQIDFQVPGFSLACPDHHSHTGNEWANSEDFFLSPAHPLWFFLWNKLVNLDPKVLQRLKNERKKNQNIRIQCIFIYNKALDGNTPKWWHLIGGSIGCFCVCFYYYSSFWSSPSIASALVALQIHESSDPLALRPWQFHQWKAHHHCCPVSNAVVSHAPKCVYQTSVPSLVHLLGQRKQQLWHAGMTYP